MDPALTADIPGHTEVYHPDTRPSAQVKDPGQGPVAPSRADVQSVVLHSYAHVMLKVQAFILSLIIRHKVCGLFSPVCVICAAILFSKPEDAGHDRCCVTQTPARAHGRVAIFVFIFAN
jgi:hypothetical protein